LLVHVFIYILLIASQKQHVYTGEKEISAMLLVVKPF
jgi:hypothetical protein